VSEVNPPSNDVLLISIVLLLKRPNNFSKNENRVSDCTTPMLC
jgi:hypothetical protein